ncbi:MAG TPA: thioredoxin [Candidatus Dojkabacteria bacterium]|nr:thioredoxin [Candidatus Dojkabacteria bacterium]HQF37077.1 thioredoxin [Candidatus Dojkabacteria bacterium]
MAKQFTDSDFATSVEQFKGLAIVDFWASWCGPCLMVGPVIEELVEEYKDNPGIIVGKVNVDDCREIASKYEIMSIPTVLIFKDGQVVETIVGARNKMGYMQMIDKHK